MADTMNPAAVQHLPIFITPPGQTDVLMNVVIVFLLVVVLIVGNLYLRLHALPERMAHRANLVQFEFVAVLALLALFTHNNLLWVAALLLALVRIPDFSSPLASIAGSLETLARGQSGAARMERTPDHGALRTARTRSDPDPEPATAQADRSAPHPVAGDAADPERP